MNNAREMTALGSQQASSSSPFKALEHRRAFEEIILQISDAVIDGRLRPGDRLPSERDLADTFGVSRASVREALRALEMFGVLTARRGTGRDAGSIVADGSAEGLTSALRMHAGLLQISMRDIVDIRAVLETYAARKAAERDDPQPELRDLIERMKVAEDLESYNQLDTEFHVALARASGNVLLPLLMESIRSAMRRDMVEGFKRLDDWHPTVKRLIKEHERITACIEKADPDGAVNAIQAHIMKFYRDVIDAPAES